MDELYKSLKLILSERVASPLLCSYFISWSILNYRFYLIIFSKEELSKKLTIIDGMYQKTEFTIEGFNIPHWVDNGFIIPILISLCYIFIYPYIAKPVYSYSLKKQSELKAMKQKIEKTKLLSVEESVELYTNISKQKEQHESEIKYLNNQISALNKRIEINTELTSEKDNTILKLNEQITTIKERHELDTRKNKIINAENKNSSIKLPAILANKHISESYDNIKESILALPAKIYSFEEILSELLISSLPFESKKWLNEKIYLDIKNNLYKNIVIHQEENNGDTFIIKLP